MPASRSFVLHIRVFSTSPRGLLHVFSTSPRVHLHVFPTSHLPTRLSAWPPPPEVPSLYLISISPPHVAWTFPHPTSAPSPPKALLNLSSSHFCPPLNIKSTLGNSREGEAAEKIMVNTHTIKQCQAKWETYMHAVGFSETQINGRNIFLNNN